MNFFFLSNTFTYSLYSQHLHGLRRRRRGGIQRLRERDLPQHGQLEQNARSRAVVRVPREKQCNHPSHNHCDEIRPVPTARMLARSDSDRADNLYQKEDGVDKHGLKRPEPNVPVVFLANDKKYARRKSDGEDCDLQTIFGELRHTKQEQSPTHLQPMHQRRHRDQLNRCSSLDQRGRPDLLAASL
jgi:hypothetical protein